MRPKDQMLAGSGKMKLRVEALGLLLASEPWEIPVSC